MRHVIIGNSAAGVRAAETLRSLDPNAEIVMIAEENLPAYSRCLLPNFLAGTRVEDNLRIRPRDFYSRNRIKTLFGQRAVGVDAKSKEVKLEDGTVVPYDKLLIATGASSSFPPVPGVKGENVFGLRHLSDAKGILRACNGARKVVIIGGGFVGLETAYALYGRGLEVTVVEKMPHILPQQFDALAASILMRDMQAEGIRFILGKGIKEIAPPGLWSRLFGRPGKGIILEDGERLKADVVVIATGTRPNVEVVRDSGMVINRGIPVNEYMETSIPDIYAAGDVAETKDVVTGQMVLTPIWPNACAQGRIAAYNMAGIRRPYSGMVGMQNAVEFREVPAIAMGLTQPPEGEYEILVDYQPDRNRYKKLVLRDNILIGMILVGDIHQAGVYGALIKKKAEVRPFRHLLLRDDFNYGHIFRH
ncbi:Pyridine nucleotide-disulphide oxidoreductase [Thermanaeromonas toyohensis ToBE]|uniref:Pyridine nucleotide-disulphide oxidoreductase n=1 Tax=Thermanaeromonas toyohensis ToBE TaxID=698762 RepID=A0A1W1W0C1_9FIRM|nr:FAD-dependent oxidoreductase [Thermanaeromonas toyohensis]SMB99082.1 Pyridine nucleotide-disulphide oxidoreductase [Thermanaeromonas toyohensis ToBE]